MLPNGINITVLDRDESAYKGDKGVPGKFSRNYDQRLHPFGKAREYQRAVAAAKVRKMFAKPFVCSLDGHLDTPTGLGTSHNNVHDLFSCGADGHVVQWNLHSKSAVRKWEAHNGWATGISISPDDQYAFTVGRDKKVRQWIINENVDLELQEDDLDTIGITPVINTTAPQAVSTYNVKGPGHSIDFQWTDSVFCVAADVVEVFDLERKESRNRFSMTNSEGYLTAKFCPSDSNLILATGGDRSLMLIDLRTDSPARKITMGNNLPCVAWNPQDPQMAIAGSEDSNIYHFDMRYFETPSKIRRGHVRAVNSVSFDPSGRRFVSGSDDCTIRIHETRAVFSKDCYHTKRMQKIATVDFSRDGNYCFSGSNDFSVRMWRADASFKASAVTPQEKSSMEYRDKLIQKHKHMPEMKKIMGSHSLPKFVKTMANENRIKKQSGDRKDKNVSHRRSYKPRNDKKDVVRKID